MENFRQFFSEALGRYARRIGGDTSKAFKRAQELGSPYTDVEAERRAGLIDAFKAKRSKDYPGKFNFVLTDQFKQLLVSTYNLLDKDPMAFIIYGDPGVGKSQIISQGAKDLVARENKKFPSTDPDGKPVERKFVEWNKVSTQQKNDIMNHPERYYVFLDIRAAFFTTASVEGMPVTVKRDVDNDLTDYNYQEFYDVIPDRYVAFITNPKAAGVLFLDEINQASTEVKHIFLQVILERVFKNLPISPRILILAASNLGQAFRGQDMNAALSSRFLGAVLVPDPYEWFNYAKEQNVDPWVIDFVRTDPDQNFYRFPAEKNVQFPNPRAIMRFNSAFKDILQEFEDIKASGNDEELRNFDFMGRVKRAAAGLLDTSWADEFVDFLKQEHEFDIEELAASEEKFKGLGVHKEKRLLSTLISKILSDIDEAIIPGKTIQVDAQDITDDGVKDIKLTIPAVDEALLKNNLASSMGVLKRLSNENTLLLLKDLKYRDPELAILIAMGLEDDEGYIQRINQIAQTIPAKI